MALPNAAAASARPAVPIITRRNAKTNPSSMIARTTALSAGGIEDACARSAPAILGSSRSIFSEGRRNGKAIEKRSTPLERPCKHHAEERNRQKASNPSDRVVDARRHARMSRVDRAHDRRRQGRDRDRHTEPEHDHSRKERRPIGAADAWPCV